MGGGLLHPGLPLFPFRNAGRVPAARVLLLQKPLAIAGNDATGLCTRPRLCACLAPRGVDRSLLLPHAATPRSIFALSSHGGVASSRAGTDHAGDVHSDPQDGRRGPSLLATEAGCAIRRPCPRRHGSRAEGGAAAPCTCLPAAPVARSEAVCCCQGAWSGSGAADPRRTDRPSCGIGMLRRVVPGCLGPRQRRALVRAVAEGHRHGRWPHACKASGHDLSSPERTAPAGRGRAGDLTCPNTRNSIGQASALSRHPVRDVRHGRAASNPCSRVGKVATR